MMDKVYIPKTIPEFELEEDHIPWLTEDKIDAPIWVRWADYNKFYVTYITHSTTSDITTTCWFKPRYIKIDTLYTTADIEQSKSITIENNGSITTESMYADSAAKWYSNWVWASVKAVDLRDSWNECYMYVTDVSNTWFTLWTITLNWNTVWLHITIIW